MLRFFCPSERAGRLTDIDFDRLRQMGIRGLLLDLDNTVTEWGSDNLPQDILQWLDSARQAGMLLCLISNNSTRRVRKIAGLLDMPCVARASKPRRKGFKHAISLLGLECNQVAVIGDQLLTDVFGGNRVGLYTFWVEPLSDREFIGTKFTRMVERIIARALVRRGILKNQETDHKQYKARSASKESVSR